jgi:hypothetical protein
VNVIKSIEGVANDDVTIKDVKIVIQRLSDNHYWNGTKWIDSEYWLAVNGTYSWSYDSDVRWTTNHTYNVRSRAIDSATNIEPVNAGSTFTYDCVKPTSSIVYPADNSVVNNVDSIKGTAKDDVKLKKVELSIKRLNDNYYWNGKKWVDREVWLPTLGTNVWVYDSSKVRWVYGDYIVCAKSVDYANNTEISKSNTFRFDSTQPWSNITYPLNSSVASTLSKVEGTANDDSGIRNVEIAIIRVKDDYYWNGTSWTKSKRWLLATGTTTWSYNSTEVAWQSGEKYTIRSRAIDIATNIELVKPGNTFTFDTEKPKSMVTSPSNGTSLVYLKYVKGISIDNVGVKNVKISIKRLSDNYQWTGTSWSNTEKWLTVTGTSVWSYDTSSVPWLSGEYNIRSIATDLANNKESVSDGVTFTIVNFGRIEGIVNDTSGRPIPDVIVKVTSNSTRTNITGYYKFEIEPGVYNITAWKYGYLKSIKRDIRVYPNKTTNVDFVLQTATGSIKGCVVDNTNNPIENVHVVDITTNISTVTTENGTFMLVGVPAGPRTIEFIKEGYTKVRQNVTVIPESVVDIGTITMYYEGYKFHIWTLVLVLLIIWIIITAVVLRYLWKPKPEPERNRCPICGKDIRDSDYIHECSCKSVYHYDCAVAGKKCTVCGEEFVFEETVVRQLEETPTEIREQ